MGRHKKDPGEFKMIIGRYKGKTLAQVGVAPLKSYRQSLLRMATVNGHELRGEIKKIFDAISRYEKVVEERRINLKK